MPDKQPRKAQKIELDRRSPSEKFLDAVRYFSREAESFEELILLQKIVHDRASKLFAISVLEEIKPKIINLIGTKMMTFSNAEAA